MFSKKIIEFSSKSLCYHNFKQKCALIFFLILEKLLRTFPDLSTPENCCNFLQWIRKAPYIDFWKYWKFLILDFFPQQPQNNWNWNWNWLLNLNLIYKVLRTGARSDLMILMLDKILLVLLDHPNNTGANDVKIDMSVLLENHILRCWGWLSLLNWIEALILHPLLKLSPRKLEPWSCFRKFENNFIVMSSLVSLVAISNC